MKIIPEQQYLLLLIFFPYTYRLIPQTTYN